MTTRKATLKAQAERKRFWQKITRDLVLFTVGLLGFIFEVVRGNDPREAILIMEAGMMGLPAILRADELRRRVSGEDV